MENHEQASESGPTYQTIVFITCGIIGWFCADFVYATRGVHLSYEKRLADLERELYAVAQKRLTEMEAGQRDAGSRIDRLRSEVDVNTKLLRELDRDTVRRKP